MVVAAAWEWIVLALVSIPFLVIAGLCVVAIVASVGAFVARGYEALRDGLARLVHRLVERGKLLDDD